MDLHGTVICCMCGDVGFSEKLFRCSACLRRFQHSYCSNYYGEGQSAEVCDWCRSEGEAIATSSSFGNSAQVNEEARSPYSAGKIKRQYTSGMPQRSAGKTPSPRHAARRYKLLKDVMC